VQLGVWSYSFYLLQQPVLLMTAPLAHRVTDSPMLLLFLGSTVCLALVVLGSWIMHRLVERPSIDLGARLVAARRARAAAEPVSVEPASTELPIVDAAQPVLGTTG
jgi:peptidoglycan/LPS O-acetylase OafA/YrhL